MDPAGATDRRRRENEEFSLRDTDVATAAIALAIPGMLLMGITWLGVRRVILRCGAGAVVLAAGARPPRPGDLEERQLVNLVEELAVAAGVPPPTVMLLDSNLLNAAVVGRSIDDATLLFPRRMLDDLGRGPTGALVADLLAVVVNGDLRIALVIASVFQTIDLVGAALTAPFQRETRAVLWRLFRLALRRRSRRGDGTEAHFVAEDLAAIVAHQWDDTEGERKGGCWTAGVRMPFLLASMLYGIIRITATTFLVTPLMAALWRRRRLLADATAIELTRDPASLAQAFDYLAEHGNTLAAGPWTHLFVVGPEVQQERVRRWMAQHPVETWRDRPGTAVAYPGNRSAERSTSDNDLDGFLPPLSRRRERLAAIGMGEVAPVEAALAAPPPPELAPWSLKTAVGMVGLGLLFLVMGLLLLVAVALLTYLALFFWLVVLGFPALVVHVLLR